MLSSCAHPVTIVWEDMCHVVISRRNTEICIYTRWPQKRNYGFAKHVRRPEKTLMNIWGFTPSVKCEEFSKPWHATDSKSRSNLLPLPCTLEGSMMSGTSFLNLKVAKYTFWNTSVVPFPYNMKFCQLWVDLEGKGSTLIGLWYK